MARSTKRVLRITLGLLAVAATVYGVSHLQEKVERTRDERDQTIVTMFAALHRVTAERQRKEGKVDDAIASYNEILKLHPDQVEVRLAIGETLFDAKRLHDAVATLDGVLGTYPNSAEAHNLRALALHELGRLDEAIAGFRRAVRLAPLSPQGHDNLGRALVAAGSDEQAVLAFERAVHLDETLAPAQFSLGKTLERLGRLDKAIDAYQMGVRADGSQPELHRALLAALRANGDEQEASAVLERMFQLEIPERPVSEDR